MAHTETTELANIFMMCMIEFNEYTKQIRAAKTQAKINYLRKKTGKLRMAMARALGRMTPQQIKDLEMMLQPTNNETTSLPEVVAA